MRLEANCTKAVLYTLLPEPNENGEYKNVILECTGPFWNGFHPNTETHLCFPEHGFDLWVIAAQYVFSEDGYELHIHVGGWQSQQK